MGPTLPVGFFAPDGRYDGEAKNSIIKSDPGVGL